MNPTGDDVKRAIAAARDLETQGYFAKVKTGDEKAASYFARMVAARANPTGAQNDWGWLSKPGGGFNVEGFADGAIVFGNDSRDLTNVLKIVTQVGSTDPNAITIGSAVQPRRAVDVWVSPVPLPDALGNYLLNGGQPRPVPPPAPRLKTYEELGGDEGAKKITRILEHDYKFAKRPGLDGDCGGWLRRTDYDVLSGICATVEESIAKHRDEWLMALGLIGPTQSGMMSHARQCLICEQWVGYEKGKTPPPIPHAPDCTTK